MKYILWLVILCAVFFGIYTWTNSSDTVVDTKTAEINNDIQDIPTPQDIDTERPPYIYALWDSLTAGYGLDIEDGYPAQLQWLLSDSEMNYKVINAGLSGDTSRGLVSRSSWLLEDAQAWDIAIIVIWANDGMRSLSLQDLEANISTLIETIQAKDMQIVLWGMMVPTNLAPEYRSDFEAIYPRLAQTYDIPLIPFFLEWVAWDPSLNLPDGIHPTKDWYSIISQAVFELLVQEALVE